MFYIHLCRLTLLTYLISCLYRGNGLYRVELDVKHYKLTHSFLLLYRMDKHFR